MIPVKTEFAVERGSGMAEELKGQEGRQGKRGKPTLVVLGVSVALALVAMVGLLT